MASYFVLELIAERSVLELLPHELSKKYPKSFLGASEALPARSSLELHEGVPQWSEEHGGGTKIECYFSSEQNMAEVQAWIGRQYPPVLTQLSLQADQDWNALWRSHFKGVSVEPSWQVLPIWETADFQRFSGKIVIRMNPSLGFGTGEHPTTQLCLRRIGEWPCLMGKTLLDFGSGSGILAVGAALRGAQTVGVEIDEMALQSSRELAEINGVIDRCRFSQQLDTDDQFDFVVANILRATLLEFCEPLVLRTKPGGRLLISGLLNEHVDEVSECFSKAWTEAFSQSPKVELQSHDQWRSLEFF